MKKIFAIFFCSLYIPIASAQTETTSYRSVDKEKINQWVDSVFATLNQEEKIGQLMMVIANPKSDNRNMQKLKQYVNDLKIGGILFHKGDPITQADVTNRLQKEARIPLFISLDGEWGLSMRLSGTTRFPRNMMLGAIENDTLITLYGEEVGRQCKEMGIHINFAPALDVNSNIKNPVIGTRSFGENPHAVADKGIAYSKGLEKTGILSVAKHFPGHGDTSEDSHYTLPVIRHNIERLDSVELLPFKRYIYDGYAGVMTSHLYVPSLEEKKDRPASLSQTIVTDLLKNKLGFQGLTFTDALAMKGTGDNKKESISVKALIAGNDVLLASATPINDMDSIKQALSDGRLNMKDIEAKCRKILSYKYIAGLHNYQPIVIKGLSERINSPHAAWLAAKLNAEGITLLKNESDFVPLKELDKKKIAVLSLGDSEGNTFQAMLKNYDHTIAFYSIERTATAAQQQKVYNELEKYDLIICGIHTVRIAENELIKKLATKKEMVFSFFTPPYFCNDYKKTLDNTKAIIMAYEATPLAQEYAAQIIFGGIPAKGKLPVSIPDMYFAGTGVFTEKTRLGYHEPEEVGANSRRLSMIDSIIQDGLTDRAFPGCQVLVAQKGMIIYNKSFGYFDYNRKQKVSDTSVYDLASVSKAAGTLMAVMKSYDNKSFTLNSKISDFIPEMKGSDKQDFIIKDLLYHQTGMTPTINFYTKATPELLSATKKKDFTTEVAKNIFVHNSFKDTIMQEIKDSKLRTKGKYLYSCINFILLQKMVENLTKQPLDTILRTQYYDKLGARLLTYNPLRTIDTLQIVPTEDDKTIRKQLLRGYVHDEAAAYLGGVSGNAGLFSNANDLAKVLQLLLNQGTYGGEQYLSLETSRLFTQSKSPVSRRGLGFDKPDITNPKQSPCGLFAPASTYGHTGYTGTCFWVDPDNQLIYILLTNRVNPSRTNNKLSSLEIRSRIQDAIYKAIDRKSQKD